MLKRIALYTIVFFAIVLSGLAGQYFAGLLPQDKILKNYEKSMLLLKEEGKYPYLLWGQNSYQYSYRFDNYTDSLILQYSLYMDTRTNASSLLTNPAALGTNGFNFDEMLELAKSNAAPSNFYVRYWQGFRMIIRALLTFTSYGGIRQLLFFVLMMLISGCFFIFMKKTESAWISFAFVLSVITVNPILIGSSMQFFSCFGISLTGIIVLSFIFDKDQKIGLVFFIIAALTQFFDFYTVPALTFTYPAIALVLFRAYAHKSFNAGKTLSLLGKCLLLWFVAYVGMWICKLALTEAFTDIKGFSNGFSSFMSRIGITKVESLAQHYNSWEAIKKCMQQIFNSNVLNALILLVVLVLTIRLAIHFASIERTNLSWLIAIFLISMVPIVWIMVAAQPSSIHFWFQYRSLCGFIFGMACCFIVPYDIELIRIKKLR